MGSTLKVASIFTKVEPTPKVDPGNRFRGRRRSQARPQARQRAPGRTHGGGLQKGAVTGGQQRRGLRLGGIGGPQAGHHEEQGEGGAAREPRLLPLDCGRFAALRLDTRDLSPTAQGRSRVAAESIQSARPVFFSLKLAASGRRTG